MARIQLTVIEGGRSVFDQILSSPFKPSAAPVVVCNGCVANDKQPTDRLGNVTELFHGSQLEATEEN